MSDTRGTQWRVLFFWGMLGAAHAHTGGAQGGSSAHILVYTARDNTQHSGQRITHTRADAEVAPPCTRHSTIYWSRYHLVSLHITTQSTSGDRPSLLPPAPAPLTRHSAHGPAVGRGADGARMAQKSRGTSQSRRAPVYMRMCMRMHMMHGACAWRVQRPKQSTTLVAEYQGGSSAG